MYTVSVIKGDGIGPHIVEETCRLVGWLCQSLGVELEFTDAPWEILQLNQLIVEQLVGQTLWGAGVEWQLPLMPVVLRASYNSITSPYGRDIPGATTSIAAVGAGVFLAPNIRLDVLMRRIELSELRLNYGDSSYGVSQYTLTRTPFTIAAGLTYRYR
jgi:hypothetical protein